MANPQGASFIPKRPTKGNIKSGGVRRIYVLSYVSYVFFFGTLIAAAGVFFYQWTLENDLNQQQEFLAQQRNDFNQSDIERIRELEQRLITSKQLLDGHMSVFSLLQSLERSVVDTVQLLAFSYSRPIGGGPQFSVTGQSKEFDPVLFQRSIITGDRLLGGVSMSEVSVESKEIKGAEVIGADDEGKTISFTLTGILDPSILGYNPGDSVPETEPIDIGFDTIFDDAEEESEAVSPTFTNEEDEQPEQESGSETSAELGEGEEI